MSKKILNDRQGNIERVVCYVRVSHLEQKLHGLSLDAQRDALTRYAEKHNLKIVGWYEDEGISGRKLIKNRPALQRMIKDAQAGKFDRIIFIKLDRFFRSIAEYHECMKIIDPVIWTATEEKYDLSTANGRAFVNMKLTIAELEADQTGERIDLVNEYKVRTGQALTGSHSQGYAFTVVKDKDGLKRVIKDTNTAHVVDDYIKHFLTHNNKRQAHIFVKNKHHVDVSYNSLSKLLSDTRLYGHYRDNDNYCEPYIDKATFMEIQKLLKKNIKKTSANRTYLFTGLIKCPKCNKIMTGKYTGGIFTNKKPSGKVYQYEREYFSYRCNAHHTNTSCTFGKQINENKVEKVLLDNLEQYVNATIIAATATDNRADVDNESVNKKIKDIKSEMTKVMRMYRKGDMSEADYDIEIDELKNDLQALESQLIPLKERDMRVYEDLLKSDWKELYRVLNKENKRAFWRKYIKAIELNLDGTVKDVIFF